MIATVVKPFFAMREGRGYEAGDVYEGSERRVKQLVERGYVEVEKPKPRKAKTEKAED